MTYNITGYNPATSKREHLFTWRGQADAGIAIAGIEAARFGTSHYAFKAEVAS